MSSPISYLERLPAQLPERVSRIVQERYGEVVAHWARSAAMSFSAQLLENGAQPHRFVTDQYAPALGLSPEHVATIGDALDVLQVSFDLADNLADRELDEANGRSYMKHCDSVPLAVLTYLPAVLAARAIDLIYAHFSGAEFTAATAVAKLGAVIGDMVRGQAEGPESEQRVELLSGKQGLLLCLPVWLRSNADLPCDPRAFEAWAYVFGRTWELHQVHRAKQTPETQAAWMSAVHDARALWPGFGPFLPGSPLEPRMLIPACLC